MSSKPIYKRVLLKASGEALMGDQGFGIDVAVADRIASDIAEALRNALSMRQGAGITEITIRARKFGISKKR